MERTHMMDIQQYFTEFESDNNPNIVQLEQEFIINKHKLRAISKDEKLHYDYAAILYSRTTAKWYYWPRNRSLNIDEMKFFADYGHTLSVDYRLTQTRMAAWDFDCICRRFNKTATSKPFCISLDEIIRICAHIVLRLKQMSSSSSSSSSAESSTAASSVQYTLPSLSSISPSRQLSNGSQIKWQLQQFNCGYHFYTDFPITATTHLTLTTEMNKIYERCHTMIEVPIFMPLPYSCKRSKQTYQKCTNGYDSFELLNVPLSS